MRTMVLHGLTRKYAADFAVEIWSSLRFFYDYARGKPNTHTPRPSASTTSATHPHPRRRPTFEDAFGIYTGGVPVRRTLGSDSHLPAIQDGDEEGIRGGEGHGGDAGSASIYGYDQASPLEAIPMHSLDDRLNVEELAYRTTPPGQVQYQRVQTQGG